MNWKYEVARARYSPESFELTDQDVLMEDDGVASYSIHDAVPGSYLVRLVAQHPRAGGYIYALWCQYPALQRVESQSNLRRLALQWLRQVERALRGGQDPLELDPYSVGAKGAHTSRDASEGSTP